MTIAIDARFIYTSTGRYVERLIRNLAQLDSETTYLILLRQDDYERWQPPAANFEKVLANYEPYTFGEQIGLARLLYRLKPDLVHFTMPQQPLLYLRKRITTIHDLTLIDYVNRRSQGFLKDIYKQQLKPAVFKYVMHRVARSSSQVITPTEYIKQQLIDRYHVDSTKITVTLEAADRLAETATPYEPVIGKNFLLYVGNAFPYKNLTFAIDAFVELQRQYPDLYLVLTGKTDYFYEELAAMVKARNLENIIFTGFAADEVVVWLYQHARFYIFPSLSEGFGLPPLEAMLEDAPVVSSNASCLPEVYGDAVAYFDPRDKADFVRVVSENLADDHKRQALITAGKKRAKMFSWRRMAEQTLTVYRHQR